MLAGWDRGLTVMAGECRLFLCKKRGCRPEPVPGLDPGIGMTNGASGWIGL
jgi:hypothetical protein